ncbi:MAG: GMC family oxidoreductase [Pseudomonadota bacterium]
MIRNGKDIPNGSVLSTQVCIIGSGPAGITAAWYLQKAGVKVILIEGSRDYGAQWWNSWADKKLLYNGKADGLFATNNIEPDFLIRPYAEDSASPRERERVFGGTSTHWGGQSRPLDPIVFEKRENFPGWPINRTDLDPYYAEAATFCKLHSNNFSAEYWANILQAEVPCLDGFNTEMYQFIGGNYLNFASRTFDGITIGQSAVDVILNASLLNINHQQGSVAELSVASMGDTNPPQKATEFTIKADIYVLACGAVANAHQLLLSNAGNEHDLVGRYFMCHPLSQDQVIHVTHKYLSESESRLMDGQTPSGQWQDANGVTVTGRFIPTAEVARSEGIGRCWFWANYGQYYFEMAPNPESRVTLADTLDPVFQQRQTMITWKLSAVDEQTYEKSTALFKAAVNKLDGDISYLPWSQVKNQLTVNGHHIGTTRMSNDPAQGVVNSDLRVHSLDNLYVAGSSVFPTTGISNPTFTIIALSIRLAEYLSNRLERK